MRNRIFVLVLLLPFSFLSKAQRDSTQARASYFFSVHSGGLFGERGQGAALTTAAIQGVRYKRFAVGVGIGYDAYADWRTMPLFVNVNYDLFRVRGNSFFIQMNGGFARAWNPQLDGNQSVFYKDRNICLNPSAGYRILSQKFSLYLSAGYKFQRLEYGWTWGGPGSTTEIKRDIERLCIQLGAGFW